MITKGVASVRSPVCNLQQFSSSISHETFSVAVVKAFREEYNIDEEVRLLFVRDTLLNRCYSHRSSEGMVSYQVSSISAKAWLNFQCVSSAWIMSHTVKCSIFRQSWEWAYGQTPEFVYSIKNSFAWGDVVSAIQTQFP